MNLQADVAIIGAGIAGASIAAELAPHLSVLVVEAEDHPGYHSTGRSAAFWSETYGGPLIQPLTTASFSLLAAPPPDFSERAFLTARGAIHIADKDGSAELNKLEAEFAASSVRLERLGREQLESRIPGLLPGWDDALFEPSCADIDVAGLHSAYLRAAARAGARLLSGCPLLEGERSAGGWRLATGKAEIKAAIVVNAAGAWADEVASLLGLAPIGIQPFRRTIAQLRIDPPARPGLPLLVDAAGRFYFKPEAGGRIWLSPHDETPCPPSDCAPEEIDVAIAIDRLEKVVGWRVERVERSWAGLRSFAPDRLPVYGFDPSVDGFFWFAGQGGFGIQTAPAAAKLGAALLRRLAPDPGVAAIDPEPYAPSRFRN